MSKLTSVSKKRLRPKKKDKDRDEASEATEFIQAEGEPCDKEQESSSSPPKGLGCERPSLLPSLHCKGKGKGDGGFCLSLFPKGASKEPEGKAEAEAEKEEEKDQESGCEEQEQEQEQAPKRVLVVALPRNVPPFVICDQDECKDKDKVEAEGEEEEAAACSSSSASKPLALVDLDKVDCRGIDLLVWREIARLGDFDIKVYFYDFNQNVFELLEQGKIDVIGDVWAPRHGVDLTISYFQTTGVASLWVYSDAKTYDTTLKIDQPDVRVGVVDRTWINKVWYPQSISQAELILFDSSEAALAALNCGEIDVFITYFAPDNSIARGNFCTALLEPKLSTFALRPSSSCHSSGRGSDKPSLLRQLNAILQQLWNNGFLFELVRLTSQQALDPANKCKKPAPQPDAGHCSHSLLSPCLSLFHLLKGVCNPL